MPAWRSISLWMDQLEENLCPRPSLEQDLDVDVTIIGAGYTGLWTAYYLKRHAPELSIAMPAFATPDGCTKGTTLPRSTA